MTLYVVTSDESIAEASRFGCQIEEIIAENLLSSCVLVQSVCITGCRLQELFKFSLLSADGLLELLWMTTSWTERDNNCVFLYIYFLIFFLLGVQPD